MTNKQRLSNEFLGLEYLTDSLRIIGLAVKGGKNLLADLSHLPPIKTSIGDFYFRGGHRLWHAPESMPRTYAPDSGDLAITQLENGVILETGMERENHIRKRIEIRLAKNAPEVALCHTLINEGMWAIEFAPWTITQFRLGGTVILPLPSEKADPAGLLPNRQITFWPYSDLSDERLILQDKYSFFRAKPAPAFKIGYFNPLGWLAYWIDGTFFKKTIEVHSQANYPDGNSNTEMYCNEDFVELEGLGPLVRLAPGEFVEFSEKWEITESLPPEFKKDIDRIAAKDLC